MSDPERVLLRLPNWVGDLVMVTPALRAVRRAFPNARVTAAVRGYGLPVLGGLQTIDEIWPIGRRFEHIGPGILEYARELRARRFDLAVLFTNSLTSALGPWLARIPRRVGYEGDWRTPFLTTRAPRSDRRAPVPMPRFYLDLLAAAGVEPAGVGYDLPVRQEDRSYVDDLFARLGIDAARPIAALNPGAKFGSSKLWPIDRFAAVGDALVRRFGYQVLLVCGPDEVAIARAITSAMREPVASTHDRVVPLAPLRALMQRIDLLVTTDTGPRHMAVAFERPTVVVMGSTHPVWTDWNMGRTRVVRHDVPCGPCHLRVCPLDHACMELVTVEEVLAAVEDLRR